MKTCPHCGVIQTDENSGKHLSGKQAGRFLCLCRGCNSAKALKWHKDNRERHIVYMREHYQANKEAQARRNKQWKAENRNRYQKSSREWNKRREDESPDFKLRNRMRHRVFLALRGVGAKSARTTELLGCSVSELRSHLEKSFQPGMTWENYGPVWHVDHKRPCASYDLTDPAQQRECFNFSNLQPLFAEENRKKGATYAG